MKDGSNLLFPSEYRYERKYLVENRIVKEILNHIKVHPAQFKEIYYPRKINNIYFDDYSFTNYHLSNEGISNRKKFRVRWYGNTFGRIAHPCAEIKSKKGVLVKKVKSNIDEFNLHKDKPHVHFKDGTVFSSLSQSSEIRSIFPVLLNCYQRMYFIDKSGVCRLTVDTELKNFKPGIIGFVYYPENNFAEKSIIEFKYKPEHEDKVLEIAQDFQFRVSRMSKYVHGVDVISGGIL